MPYRLTSEELLDYMHERIKDLSEKHKYMKAELSDDNSGLVVTIIKGTHRGRSVTLTPSFVQVGRLDRVEIEISPDIPGEKVNSSDVSGFLEQMVATDRIFERGQPLYSREREEHIPYWKSVLKRTEGVRSNVMACTIADKSIGADNLRKAVYGYMVRACLHYLIQAGSFKKQ